MSLKVTFPGDKRVNAEIRGFSIATDQPISAGGTNSAPTPFELFLASIGTCAGIYAVEFLNQRGIDPSNASIELDLVRDPDSHMVRKITIHLNLPADFPEKYKTAITKTVNLCAVKKHLHDPPEFETIIHMDAR